MINNIIIYLRIHFWVKRKESFRALNIDNSLLNKNNSKEKVIKFILSKKTMCSLKLLFDMRCSSSDSGAQ